MKKAIAIIITVILLLIMVPALMGFSAVVSVNDTVNWDSFRAAALEAGWVDSVRNQLRAAFVPLNDVTGIPEEVTEAFLTESVTDEICAFFWDGQSAAFPQEELTRDLADRIVAYAAKMRDEGKITFTQEEWADVEENAADTAGNYVESAVHAVQVTGLRPILKTAEDYWKKLFPYVAAAGGAAILVCLGLLALIHKKKILEVVYTAFTGVGIVWLFSALWLRVMNYAARIPLGPARVEALVARYYDIICGRLALAGGILAVIGVLCGVGAILVARREKESVKNVEEVFA